MNNSKRRIAINIGGGFVPGLNAVIAGTVMAFIKPDKSVVDYEPPRANLLRSER